MRNTSLILAMLLLLQFANAQLVTPVSANRPYTVRPVVFNSPVASGAYDAAYIDMKLKKAKRLTTAGIVVTSAAGAVFVSGVLVLCIPEKQTQPTGTDLHKTTGGRGIFAIIMWGSSLPVFLAGIPMLVTGEIRLHKWQQLHNQLNVKAGLLESGNLGVAMAF